MKSAETIVEEILVEKILTNVYPPHTMLPPERELALLLNYSRPVIHKAIIRLEGKGLVTIVPRKGIKVDDYLISGKLGLLESLYHMDRDRFPSLNNAMLEFIIHNLEAIIRQIHKMTIVQRQRAYTMIFSIEINQGRDVYTWAHTLAIASGNPINTMLINEFQVGILNVGNAVVEEKGSEVMKQWLDEIGVLMIAESEEIDTASFDRFYKRIENVWLK